MPNHAVQADTLLALSKHELDVLFKNSPAGPIPVGAARGTLLLATGSLFGRAAAGLARALWWKGKVFSPATQDLKNLILPIGVKAIRAAVYVDDSWYAEGEAIILDYSKTSLLASKIRDEIREVSPGVYLGQVFWGKKRIAGFMLEFPQS